MGRNLVAQITGNLREQIAKYLSSRKRRKIGYWVLCSLGAVVVFCTTYALILPAITMSNEPICGIEAHTHDESCWSLEAAAPEFICEDWKDADVVIHTHNELCYDAGGSLVCPLEERELHVHDESCYVEQRTLICPEAAGEAAEPGAEAGAANEPEIREPAAGEPEVHEPVRAPHVHTESCYRRERGELICPLEEKAGHKHDEALCYTDVPTGERILVCDQDEFEIVTVPVEQQTQSMEDGTIWDEIDEGGDAAWYADDPEPVQPEPPAVTYREELRQVHWHDDSCYMPEMEHILTCQLPEEEGHTHTDECYNWELVLDCPEEASGGLEAPEAPAAPAAPVVPDPAETPDGAEPHVHTDECYEITRIPVCGEEELELHTHGPECYETYLVDDGEGGQREVTVLTCTLPVVVEHQHTEACIRQKEGDGQEVMRLTCGKEVHVHNDSCFMEMGELPDPHVCGLSEHTHTADCFFESGELRCTIPEHVHTEECLDRNNFPAPEYPLEKPGAYVCGLPEHWHTDACWSEDGELTCGQMEHVHDENCLPAEEPEEPVPEPGAYICGLPEHRHTDGCWAENGELACGQAEHVHDESCLPAEEPGQSEEPAPEPGAYVCGLPEHRHTDGCWAENGELTCGQEEHVHDESCLPAPGETDGSADTIVLEDAVYPIEMEDFVVTFHVSGVARVLDGEEDAGEGSAPALPEESGSPAAPDAVQPEPVQPEPPAVSKPEVQPGLPDEPESGAPEETIPDEEPALNGGRLLSMNGESGSFSLDGGEPVQPDQPALPDGGDGQDHNDGWQAGLTADGDGSQELQFTVEKLEEGDEGYDEALSKLEEGKEEPSAEEAEETEESILLGFLKIGARTTGGQRIDFSNCSVEVEITPTEKLTQALGEMASPMAIDGSEETAEPDAGDGGVSEVTLTAKALESDTAATATVSAAAAPESMIMTMSLDGEEETVALTATSGANPKFQVQYYAYLDTANRSQNITNATRNIGLINTDTDEGGAMPANGVKSKVTWLELDDKGAVKSTRDQKPRQVYKTHEYSYINAPGMKYFNIVTTKIDNNYVLKEVWVQARADETLAAGGLYTIETEGDTKWKVYKDVDAVRFTNREQTSIDHPEFIWITEGTVLRLVYDTTKDPGYTNPVDFYDYDITDGQIYTTATNAANRTDGRATSTQTNAAWYANTEKQGINSGAGINFAFGNSNTDNGLGTIQVDGQDLNKFNLNNVLYNSQNGAVNMNGNGSKIGGCTYNLVTGMNTAGNDVVFNAAMGVKGPQLFGVGNTTGKTHITNINTLKFNRSGDTFTLTSVPNTTATGLDTFNHPACGGTTHNHIWTNNFWPMDSANTWAADGHDLKFGSFAQKDNRKTQKNQNFPNSDDAQEHNSYFGMNFAVDFELTSDYLGPLEYLFFGDDDMWVFLTDLETGETQLVCDIGGVHQTVGEYVNLWNYIPGQNKDEIIKVDSTTPEGTEETITKNNTTTTKYRLTFFYTERGASGSTCWMQFTLPTVVGVDLETEIEEKVKEDTGALWISKKVEGIETPQRFNFRLDLEDTRSEEDKKNKPSIYDDFVAFKRSYSGEISKVENTSIANGEIIQLADMEEFVISGLPKDVTYTITEMQEVGKDEAGKPIFQEGYDGYRTDFITTKEKKELAEGETQPPPEQGSGPKATGVIEGNTTIKVAFTNHSSYELPSTGSLGTTLYTIGGALPLAAAGCLLYNKKSRRRGAADRS